VAERRRDLRKRRKDEIALEHAGVRNLELRRIDGGIAIEKNVQVDQARPLGEGFLAAHLQFDAAQNAEKFRGWELRIRFQDGVEKPGLIEIVDRLGFKEAGYFRHIYA